MINVIRGQKIEDEGISKWQRPRVLSLSSSTVLKIKTDSPHQHPVDERRWRKRLPANRIDTRSTDPGMLDARTYQGRYNILWTLFIKNMPQHLRYLVAQKGINLNSDGLLSPTPVFAAGGVTVAHQDGYRAATS